MSELGHDRIDLLKLDIEGAEYEVLDHVLSRNIPVGAICVEFHKTPSIEPMIETSRRLCEAGYEPIHVDGFDVTFVSGATRAGSNLRGPPPAPARGAHLPT